MLFVYEFKEVGPILYHSGPAFRFGLLFDVDGPWGYPNDVNGLERVDNLLEASKYSRL